MASSDDSRPVVQVPSDRSRRPLPNLVIAGPGKAGTTSLFAYLARHADICASRVKQAQYYSPAPYRAEGGKGRVADLDYLDHCQGERYRLEATPSYFYGGPDVIATIQDALADARVVITLREPVERLWSYHRFFVSRLDLPEKFTFEDYVRECERLRATRGDRRAENAVFFGLSGGFYAEWLGAWLEAFGESMRVVFFDDLAASPSRVVGELCAWLGLDPSRLGAKAPTVENPTVAYRSRALQRLAIGANRSASGVLLRHPRLKRALASIYTSVNRGASEEMGAATAARLTDLYEPSNREVAAMLCKHGYGDSLPAWLRTRGIAGRVAEPSGSGRD